MMRLSRDYNWVCGLVVVIAITGCAVRAQQKALCQHTVQFEVADVGIQKDADGEVLVFKSGMTINADGAPDAYHPKDIGSDKLSHAGRPGNWWGIATDTGKPSGTPFIQGELDPFPGYYVSHTSLFKSSKSRDDPARYVNANAVPYIVLSGGKDWGVDLGDWAMVINKATGQSSPAIVAEFGPKNKIGEGSIALAKALGVDADPRTGGIESNILYVVFPGSGNGYPESVLDASDKARALFDAWGGLGHLKQCFE